MTLPRAVHKTRLVITSVEEVHLDLAALLDDVRDDVMTQQLQTERVEKKDPFVNQPAQIWTDEFQFETSYIFQ